MSKTKGGEVQSRGMSHLKPKPLFSSWLTPTGGFRSGFLEEVTYKQGLEGCGSLMVQGEEGRLRGLEVESLP